MTESNFRTNKAAKVQFPACDFMTVGQLADYWKCDQVDLFNQIKQGRLWAHPTEYLQLTTFIREQNGELTKPTLAEVSVNWFVPMPEIKRYELTHSIGQPTTQPAHMTGKLTPEAWNGFTTEQRREQTLRRYQQLGSYAAVGREAGVTGKRIEQILKEMTPSKKRKTPSDSPTIPGAWDTTNRATSKN